MSGCGRKNESELNSELHCSLAGEGMLHVTSVCPSAGKGKSVCLLLRHVRRSLSLSLVCPGKTKEVFTEEKNSEKKKEEEASQIKITV